MKVIIVESNHPRFLCGATWDLQHTGQGEHGLYDSISDPKLSHDTQFHGTELFILGDEIDLRGYVAVFETTPTQFIHIDLRMVATKAQFIAWIRTWKEYHGGYAPSISPEGVKLLGRAWAKLKQRSRL